MARGKSLTSAAALAWLVVLAVAFTIAACTPRPTEPQPTVTVTESYELCTSAPDYGNAPCVVLSLVDGHDGYTWVAVSQSGVLVFVDMLPCASDDGPPPCIWDTRRGDGGAGPGVKQFVVIRD